jgi:hypothetical protein
LTGRAIKRARRVVRRMKGPDKRAQARPEAVAKPEPRRDGRQPGDVLLSAIMRGRGLDHAVVAQVRALIGADDHDAARSIAESLRGHAETRALGDAVGGIVAYRQGYVDLAWDHLRQAPRETWTRHAAAEYVRSGLAEAPGEALAVIRRLVAEDPPELRAKFWYDVLGPVFGMGASEDARAVFAIFDRHVREDEQVWGAAAKHRDWMREWVAADPDSPTAPGTGRRTFAVLDYGHPSATRASANIGDHVQSIAALGHLVRHDHVRLHGDDRLLGLLERLRERTRPERRRGDVETDLEVITAHRDGSIYQAIPEDTWTLAFGWYMHPLFNFRHAFPLHRNLRPIFVSFHCNKRSLLTPEAVDYLKRYGPVGCRDWTTVYLLHSIGVSAFFSGCLTTTIDAVFPDLTDASPNDAPVGYVDAPDDVVPEGAVTYHHSSEDVRQRSFVDNMRHALELLDTYRSRHRSIVTSRLHCYLPMRSIGVDVDFMPANPSDVRFDGLAGIGDAEFEAMRRSLDDRLGQVVGAIAAGRPEDDVYGLWRELTAADVAAAEQQRTRGVRLPRVRAGLDDEVRDIGARSVTRGPEPPADAVDCAVVLRRGGGLDLAVLVASLLEHASRPLHVWVLAGEGTGGGPRRLAATFPQVTVTRVPVGGLAEPLPLLVGDLLPDVERVVMLPLPSVATADVSELADLDLDDRLLAAPTQIGRNASGFGVIHDAAKRLGRRTNASSGLRRTAHARHPFDFDAFRTDVLVVDLARARREGLARQALPLVQEFGLDATESLHYLVGPGRAVVPDRWATVPTRMPVRGPGLLHWADGIKPPQAELVPERDHWRHYARPLRHG